MCQILSTSFYLQATKYKLNMICKKHSTTAYLYTALYYLYPYAIHISYHLAKHIPEVKILQ